MADNLTVDGGRPTPDGSQAKAEGKTREESELDRLRAIAKKHHGRELDDKTLKAIVAQRKAKIAKNQALDESKRDFQNNQARERVFDKATERQTLTRKATGAQEARGPQRELGSKDGKQVRSNPDASPRLPPTLDKATTPEQAAKLIDKMFSFVTMDGEVFDSKAYAETIREQPPTQPKADSKSGQRTPQGQPFRGGRTEPQGPRMQQPASSHGEPPAGQTSGRREALSAARVPTAPPKTRAATTSKTVADNKPAKNGKNLGPGAAAPRTRAAANRTPTTPPGPGPLPAETSGRAPVLAMSTRGAAASMRAGTLGPNSLSGGTGVSSDGLLNAGGGLIAHSSFDGMRFNWEAFNWFFTMVVMQDLHKYRREMKELRRLEGEAAIANMRLKQALTRMRQVFERNKATVGFFESVRSAVGTVRGEYLKLEAKETLGKTKKQLENVRKRLKLALGNRDTLKAESDRRAAGRNKNTVAAKGETGGTTAKPDPKAIIDKLTKKDGTFDREKVQSLSDAQLEAVLEHLDGKTGQLKGEQAELKGEVADLEHEARGNEGRIRRLAEELPPPKANEKQIEAFEKRLNEYKDTLEGFMRSNVAAVSYHVEQRGDEMSRELRNQINNLLMRKKKLRDEITADEIRRDKLKQELEGNRNPSANEDVLELDAKILTKTRELEQLDGQLEIASNKVLVHEATMMALTSPGDRGKALEAANEQIKKAEARALELSKIDPAKRKRACDVGLPYRKESDKESPEAWKAQAAELKRGLPLLKYAKDNPNATPWDFVQEARKHKAPEGASGDNAIAKAQPADIMRIGGGVLRARRQDRGVLGLASAVANSASKIEADVQKGTKEAWQSFDAKVDKVLDTSKGLDLKARHEADAMLRKRAQRAQGMVNQLMQLLRLQRSA